MQETTHTLHKVASVVSLQKDYSKPPIGLKWRSHTLFIISTVGIGLFTDLFLYGLVVPILPSILRDRAGVPKSETQAHVSAQLATYAVASVVASPLAGFVADKTTSRQAPFLVGLSSLIFATILFFTGKAVWILTLARALQGASSGLVWTVGLALCMDTVGPENLGKTIGSIFSIISVGELFGPVLGGVLFEKAGIAAVASLAVGVLVLDFLMRALVIEKKIANRYIQFSEQTDYQDQGQTNGNTNDEADESSPLLANGNGKHKDEDEEFFKIPKDLPRVLRAVPILYCLKSPSLVLAFIVAFVQAIIIASFDSTVPTHAEDLYGFNGLQASLLFVPLSVVSLITGPIGGWAVDRYGRKPVAVFGYAYCVPVLALLRLPQSEPRSREIAVFGVLLGLCGVGLAVIGAPSIVEAGAIVDKFYKMNPDSFGKNGPYAQLYGMNSMVFCGGLAAGPVIAGGLKDTIGYADMNAVLSAISAVTAVACFIWLGGKPKMLRSKK